MLPLAVAAVIASVAATSGAGPLVGALVAAGLAICLVCALQGRWRVCAVGAVLAVAACTGWLRAGQIHESAVAGLGRERAAVVVTGRVSSDPRTLVARGPRPEAVIVAVTAEQVRARGVVVTQRAPILVSASGDLRREAAGLQVGSRVELAGVLAPTESHDAQAAFLRLRAGPRPVAGPGYLDRVVNRVRAALAASVRHSPDDQRALVPSLVVGDTSAVGERLDEEFRATSLTHLMAVSGANLASTTALLWWVGSWLGVRRRGLQVMSVMGVAGFVIVCRSEPSVVRAAAMGMVTMAAAGLSFDRAAGIRSLSVAVVALMLADPWLCRSVGFWLSVCATAGILWWTTGFARAMRWAPEALARAIAVPWAAQLATQPVITWIPGPYLVEWRNDGPR